MFVYFDGDDIGRRLELLLLEDEVSSASDYSRAVSDAGQSLAGRLVSDLDAQIVFIGGDEILAWIDKDQVDLEAIASSCAVFRSGCGQTGSVGVGQSASEAVANLRRAKLLGKSRTVHGKRVISNG